MTRDSFTLDEIRYVVNSIRTINEETRKTNTRKKPTTSEEEFIQEHTFSWCDGVDSGMTMILEVFEKVAGDNNGEH